MRKSINFEVFYNQAIHASRGRVKLNLDGMNVLLVIPKQTPSEDPRISSPIDVEIYPS